MWQGQFWLAMRRVMAVILTIIILPAALVAASSSEPLYEFKGGNNAGRPFDTLIFDQVGNLYGTTLAGGGKICGGDDSPCGTVFKLTHQSNGSWTESVLHRFGGSGDGWAPSAGLIFDSAGNLYGTTTMGGASGRGGTVFMLTPEQNGSWTETVLYSFCQLTNCADGAGPYAALTLDGAGILYGTTVVGGAYDGGTVFKLAPSSGGGRAETVLYSFGGPDGGGFPEAALILDASGNLYGTTSVGGQTCGNNYSCGIVFELTPKANGSWKEHVLYEFSGGEDGGVPYAGLTFDTAGNLYGTTSGINGAGRSTVFELVPKPHGGWKESVLHRFVKDTGITPCSGLTLDTAGSLYGTTFDGDTFNDGVIFQLTREDSGSWAYSVLYSFGDGGLGEHPYGGLVLDQTGNLYGTTSDCAVGDHCVGVVFELTP